MPLKVIVVGAGIAGLCAAIYEKSKLAAEIGAALSVSPNGVRVPRSLGFPFEKARARQMMVWESVEGTPLKQLSSLDFQHAEEKYGAPFMAVHRVDLHKELLRLALQDGEEKGKGLEPVTLKLGAPVVNLSTEEGIVELEDGSKHEADLIVAADGLHSVVRSIALKQQAKPSSSGLSAFRFWSPRID
ncbi:hypothetical protein OEA41_004165 [Lepraria neglecta]|uniref:FAD-binding domain-containing protein n=1 Tax=Lepraria neglecta TaxID=209136 RepID=A0AAD9Z600_9LECA|nr:hypothetical protein OEA41_004165 [Lepraria neglecta]